MMPSKRKLTFGERLNLFAAAVIPGFQVDARSDLGPGWSWFGAGRPTTSGQLVNPQLALGLPAVLSCVRVLADTIAPLPVRLVKDSEDGSRTDIVRPSEHPVAMLLAEPNTSGGFGMPSLLKDSQTKFHLTGNDYVQIERGESGQPIRLWPLDPTTLPLITSDIGLQAPRGTLGYRAYINRTPVDLKPADVLHFRDISLDSIIGMSKVRMASNAIGAGLAMEEYIANFFKNDATSGGYFTHPGKLSDKAKTGIVDSLVKQTEDRRTNRKEHFQPKVLEEGMKWIQTTIAPANAELNESRERALADCARIWGVPLVLVQSTSGSTVWGTGIEQLLIGFAQITILPIVVQYQDEMTRKLLTIEERDAGYRIQFDLTKLMRGDAKSVADANNIKVLNGTKSRNEARRDDGLNPVEGLDEMLVPVNTQTLTQSQEPPPEPTAPVVPPTKPEPKK